VRWTRELWQTLQPYATGGIYVNDMGREEEDGADQVRAAYGANYQRLAELKQKYDPTNLFRHNQNIKPAVQELPAPGGGGKPGVPVTAAPHARASGTIAD
jgi:hypothetical protein